MMAALQAATLAPNGFPWGVVLGALISALLSIQTLIGAHLVKQVGRLSEQLGKMGERISHLEGKSG